MKFLQIVILIIQISRIMSDSENSDDIYGGINNPDDESEGIWDFFGEKHEKEDRVKFHQCQKDEVVKKIKNELTACKNELEILQNKPSQKQYDNTLPYFKHLLEKLSSLITPNPENPGYLSFQGEISVSEYDLLKKTLHEENPSRKLLLDQFAVMKPSTSWRVYANQIAWPILISGVASVFSIVVILYVQYWFFKDAGIVKHVLWMLFVAFVVSIPWEWYRLYNEALAKKAAKSMNEIPSECYINSLTAWSSVKMWFRDTFTLSEDKCVQYHQNLLVDPLWEVSPLQAAAVSSSRLFTEFAREFSSAMGTSFRVFLKELPAQWQPIALVLLLILLISLIVIGFGGIEIALPFTKIGVGRNRDYEIQQLKDENKRLMVELKETRYEREALEMRHENIRFIDARPRHGLLKNTNGPQNIEDIPAVTALPQTDVKGSARDSPEPEPKNERRKIVKRSRNEGPYASEIQHDIQSSSNVPNNVTQYCDETQLPLLIEGKLPINKNSNLQNNITDTKSERSSNVIDSVENRLPMRSNSGPSEHEDFSSQRVEDVYSYHENVFDQHSSLQTPVQTSDFSTEDDFIYVNKQ